MTATVKLECLNENCKKNLRLLVDSGMPKGTVSIKSFCPECEPVGARNSGERYFDQKGKELNAQI